jgi:hypothetical protein
VRRAFGWGGALLLLALHLDFWRPDVPRVHLGWLPEELAYRLGWMALAWLYLLAFVRWIWRAQERASGDAPRGGAR